MGLKLMAELGLDGHGFEHGMERAGELSKEFSHGLKSVILEGIGIYSIEQAIAKTVETAKELVETSERLSIAPENLQVLRQAARQSGVELEALAKAFEKIDIARQKAFTSGEDGRHMAGIFARLGIDRQALRSQPASALFMGPLANAARGRNSEELGPLLKEIMGKAFGQLIPVLKTDFEALHHKLQDMGAIMNTETALALKNLSTELTFISQIIVTRLGPAIIWVAELIYKSFAGIASTWASLKASTGNMTTRQKIGTAMDVVNPFGPKVTEILKRFDFKAGKAAGLETFKSWAEGLDKLKERLAEEAAKLNHPMPDFTKNALPEKMPSSALRSAPDSLTKVGNFLGGMGITNSVEQKKVSLLQQIANNTRGAVAKPLGQRHDLGAGMIGVGSLAGLAFPHR